MTYLANTTPEELERAIDLVLSELKPVKEERDGITRITHNDSEAKSKIIAICKEYNTKKFIEVDELHF